MNIKDKLQKEFSDNELEWRVQSCGISNNKPWVMALVYVQARAIQDRLDEVFGWENWSEEYREVSGNIICRLGACIDGKWIYKENGASQTDIESFKGGISGAFKRVASSGFGIGRYLYKIDVKFVDCSLEKKVDYTEKTKTKGGKKFDGKTIEQKTIYWKIPKLKSLFNNTDLEKAKSIKKLFEIAEVKKVSRENIDSFVMKVFGKDSPLKLENEQLNTLIRRLQNKQKEAV